MNSGTETFSTGTELARAMERRLIEILRRRSPRLMKTAFKGHLFRFLAGFPPEKRVSLLVCIAVGGAAVRRRGLLWEEFEIDLMQRRADACVPASSPLSRLKRYRKLLVRLVRAGCIQHAEGGH